VGLVGAARKLGVRLGQGGSIGRGRNCGFGISGLAMNSWIPSSISGDSNDLLVNFVVSCSRVRLLQL
jgi:hypothetical protein